MQQIFLMEAIALSNTVLFSKALLVSLHFCNKKYFAEICIRECRENIEQCVIMEVKEFGAGLNDILVQRVF